MSNQKIEAQKFIGKQIKTIREFQRLTQEDLAQKSGMSRVFLGQIEKGSVNPSLDTLINLCNALGYSLDISFSKLD